MTQGTELLIVERLSVTDRSGRALISNVDLHLGQGAVHVILGETGAGKSIVCAAIAGTLPAELDISGSVVLGGRELTRLTGSERRARWSRDLFLLPQEPWNALAQTRTLQRQIADMPRLFDGAGRGRANLVARGLLQRFGLSPVTDGAKLPCEISGGMAQRASIATALASPARLILVDEPTKGLDAACRAEIAAALRVLASEGRSIVAVTHDLSFARMLGGTLSVLRDGGVVETGPTADVLQAPRTDYVRDLVDAEPSRWPRRRYAPSDTILELDRATISVGEDRRPLITELSLSARAGEIVGLCGPSGCGKTTLGNVLLKLAGGGARDLVAVGHAAISEDLSEPGRRLRAMANDRGDRPRCSRSRERPWAFASPIAAQCRCRREHSGAAAASGVGGRIAADLARQGAAVLARLHLRGRTHVSARRRDATEDHGSARRYRDRAENRGAARQSRHRSDRPHDRAFDHDSSSR